MTLTAKAKYWRKNPFQCYFVERERERERERGKM
jgi:hypothetical protein